MLDDKEEEVGLDEAYNEDDLGVDGILTVGTVEDDGYIVDPEVEGSLTVGTVEDDGYIVDPEVEGSLTVEAKEFEGDNNGGT